MKTLSLISKAVSYVILILILANFYALIAIGELLIDCLHHFKLRPRFKRAKPAVR